MVGGEIVRLLSQNGTAARRYCKRALPDMLTLLKDDPKLKVVLKEFPILGPGSVEAARVAIAVRMQDPTGQKYLALR